ncbi:MAG: hypothetical protein AAF531_01935 [Actinomycetota bacterium]
MLGTILTVGPAEAAERPGAERAARAGVAADQARPVHRPPVRDLEVLQMVCEAAETDVVDPTRIRIGCRWRPAQSERAAGYQLWRVVDRGDRELVARGGLDLTGFRDVVSAEAKLVRYAVIAVDENGRRVGQSRVERVVLVEMDEHDRRLADRARARSHVRGPAAD